MALATTPLPENDDLRERLRQAMRAQFDPLDPYWIPQFERELRRGDGEEIRGNDFLTGCLHRILQGDWLNDNAIREYLRDLCRFGNTEGGRPIGGGERVTGRFMYLDSLMTAKLDAASLEQWQDPHGLGRLLRSKNLDGPRLLRPEFIFIPFNLNGNHWIMGVIYPRDRMIAVFDSLDHPTRILFEKIDNMLRFELGWRYSYDRRGRAYPQPNWGFRAGRGNRQGNLSDCGPFILTHAMCLVMGWELGFTQEDMHLKRRRIAAEILNGGLYDNPPAPSMQPHLHSIRRPWAADPRFPVAYDSDPSDADIAAQNPRIEGSYNYLEGQSIEMRRVNPPPILPQLPPLIYIDDDDDDNGVELIDSGLAVKDNVTRTDRSNSATSREIIIIDAPDGTDPLPPAPGQQKEQQPIQSLIHRPNEPKTQPSALEQQTGGRTVQTPTNTILSGILGSTGQSSSTPGQQTGGQSVQQPTTIILSGILGSTGKSSSTPGQQTGGQPIELSITQNKLESRPGETRPQHLRALVVGLTKPETQAQPIQALVTGPNEPKPQPPVPGKPDIDRFGRQLDDGLTEFQRALQEVMRSKGFLDDNDDYRRKSGNAGPNQLSKPVSETSSSQALPSNNNAGNTPKGPLTTGIMLEAADSIVWHTRYPSMAYFLGAVDFCRNREELQRVCLNHGWENTTFSPWFVPDLNTTKARIRRENLNRRGSVSVVPSGFLMRRH